MSSSDSVVIGMLHPGEMGSIVGRGLVRRGHEVLWASAGRGARSVARAQAAGLADVGSIGEVTRRADVVLSICPPHAAVEVARAVAGFGGTYVDANAISPQTAQQVASIVTGGGATYVDGGIIGPPPAEAGRTRLYLSGDAAPSVRELFDQTPLEARIVTAGPWSASSLKMAYAAWTKGSGALLLTVHALAQAEGVERRAGGRVGSVPARAVRPAARHGQVGRREGLALGRRDGGDRRDDGGRRTAGRVPSRRRRGLQNVAQSGKLAGGQWRA